MKIVRNEELLYSENRVELKVGEISYGLLDSSWKHENLRAAFTRLYIPLAGMGEIAYRGERVFLTPGNLYIVPAGLSFSCACSDRLEKLYVHLTLTHPDGSDVFWGMDSCLILPDTYGWATRAQRLYEKRDLTSVLEFKLFLYEILCHALTLANPRHTELRAYSKWTKAALSYIDYHLCATLTVREIATALFVSKNLLQKQFKEDLNKPIGKYIDDLIMARAEQYLLADDRSMKEISDQLGFCDQFYFSRKFTQAHGISPLRFRQIHRV
ncbi:MAG: helix-turn-helix transcriptional regulator [Ruminococcaceae bacterium]|nr:helix-turn-helix transcriptional regulator [Oscillospiraceae bacterium]